ncbi:MAG: SMP-30/gluconolactonase/LRE family protein [Nanoarchaeota archaeon]|nr:SMP-30/gluconolactonase/LRE family protein [Nanoarchaeota archaeon]
MKLQTDATADISDWMYDGKREEWGRIPGVRFPEIVYDLKVDPLNGNIWVVAPSHPNKVLVFDGRLTPLSPSGEYHTLKCPCSITFSTLDQKVSVLVGDAKATEAEIVEISEFRNPWDMKPFMDLLTQFEKVTSPEYKPPRTERIVSFDYHTGKRTEYISIPAMRTPRRIEFTCGALYVLNTTGTKGENWIAGYTGDGYQYENVLARDRFNSIVARDNVIYGLQYVKDQGILRVYRFDGASTEPVEISNTRLRRRMAVDSEHNVWLCGGNNQHLGVYSPEGQHVAQLDLPRVIKAMHFDTQGRLVTVEQVPQPGRDCINQLGDIHLVRYLVN